MNEQMFTEALFKIKDGLEAVAELKTQYGTDDTWEPIETAVSLNVGLLESLFEDTEGIINHFIFETNFGDTNRKNPWEDTNGIKWYFEHPIDVYDYFG